MEEAERIDPREDEILYLIREGLSITEIAKERGVKRQAVWEFCARRGWLGDDSLAKIESKDERRRISRRVTPLPPDHGRRIRMG